MMSDRNKYNIELDNYYLKFILITFSAGWFHVNWHQFEFKIVKTQ